ncbi:creatininase family protein [Lachnoclostridium sp.]|uniref:creatininase family protein n=1 Tax=Lachnoclostridium sp. TaxID=2028282 RepID=UPI002898F9A4|nr:creatininase family protein [Lachnoclostridium sp.]
MGYSIFEKTMADMTWQEVEKASKENQIVLFPLGVIEEHGPHLPLGTDSYWSYASCKCILEELNNKGERALIVPPYYWGINHCTGGFPGTFSVRPETMMAVLMDIFKNLHDWGFHNIFCNNCHGDVIHIRAILDAIKTGRNELGLNIRILVDFYDLSRIGLKGDEDFILVLNPEYPEEFYAGMDKSEIGLFDIHAGGYETAFIKHYFSELVNEEVAKNLKSTSLTNKELEQWGRGGEATRTLVPLGYAGNPAGYKNIVNLDCIEKFKVEYTVKRIMESLNGKA